MVSPVITMAIHMFVQWAFGFSYILFVATIARDQIDNILCCAVCVLPQSYSDIHYKITAYNQNLDS